jgi:hypothetical protein
MKVSILPLLFSLLLTNAVVGQQNSDFERKPDIVSLGLGLGFDYGGIGASLLYYPQKNIGLFFGGGYAIAGFGYNAGLKLKLSNEKPTVVSPFIMAMYGYNAAVAVSGNSSFDKLFYGPSFGAGIDIRSKRPNSKGYLSIALLIPVRNPDVNNYINDLQTNDGVSFSNLPPVGISIGYRFLLN